MVMLGSSSLRLRLGGTLAAGAVLAAVAGCSSGSSSSAAAPASSSASAASSAASSSAPASASSSAPAAPASSAAPAGSKSPHAVSGSAPAVPVGPAGCATRDLQAKAGVSQGAAGSVYQVIDFTNTGTAACTLYGYPGVSLATGTPLAQVGAAAARSTTASPTLVTLAPGATANALLRITQALNYPSAACSPKATTYLRVYPPNQTTAINVAYPSTGCSSSSVKLLTIGVVQAGAGTAG